MTLHDGGRQAAVISAVPGAAVFTVPRLTAASAGWELNQMSERLLVELFSAMPWLSVTSAARVTVELTGAVNEVLGSVSDFWT